MPFNKHDKYYQNPSKKRVPIFLVVFGRRLTLLTFFAGKSDSTCTLHTLTLLKEVLAVFPQGALKSTCETILKLLTLSSVVR